MNLELWHMLPGYQLDTGRDNAPAVKPYQMEGATAVLPIIGPPSKYGAWGTTSTRLADKWPGISTWHEMLLRCQP